MPTEVVKNTCKNIIFSWFHMHVLFRIHESITKCHKLSIAVYLFVRSHYLHISVQCREGFEERLKMIVHVYTIKLSTKQPNKILQNVPNRVADMTENYIIAQNLQKWLQTQETVSCVSFCFCKCNADLNVLIRSRLE